MFKIKSKKSKLNMQVRGVGESNQPAPESDLRSLTELSESELSGVSGGFEIALGKTRSCGVDLKGLLS